MVPSTCDLVITDPARPIPSAMKKKTILSLVIVLLAIDVIVLAVPRSFQAAFIAWIQAPSQCSLSELWNELRRKIDAAPAVALEPTLERTEGGLDSWKTEQGLIWTVHGDKVLWFLTSEQRLDIYEPQGHEVRSGDIVLDCGANIGMFTRKALSRGAKLVVAVEPAPQTLNALRRNFETEIREGRVIVYPKGVWDREAELELSQDARNAGSNSVVRLRDLSIPRVRVPLTTIDKIVTELQLPRVDFIKMDIEGSEKPALKGGENTIRRFQPRMSISTEHLADDFTAIPALVHSIEPSYANKACYCVLEHNRVKALVMAFDPNH